MRRISILRYVFLLPLLFEAIQSSGQLSALNDEFNQACTISDWQDVNVTEGWDIQPLEILDIDQTNQGFMTLMPYTVTWFENYKGALIYKTVEDNFVATTRILASNRSYDGMPNAASQYSLAGIMLRTPKDLTNGDDGWVAGAENYIFLSAGYASTAHPTCPGCPGPHFEVKNTTNSISNLEVSSIDTLDVLIRVARIDEAIIVLYQLAGEEFIVHRRYARTDFPDSMQIGMVTYTDYPKANTYTAIFQNSHVLNVELDLDPSSNPGLPFNPDLIGRYDYLRFDSVEVPQALTGLDLTDPGQVSEEELLSFLGYPSSPLLSESYHSWSGGVSTDWSDPDNWTSAQVPAPGDSVLITACDCPLSNVPALDLDTVRLGRLLIAQGGSLMIPSSTVLILEGDQIPDEAILVNEGSLIVEGDLLLSVSNNLEIENYGNIFISAGGLLRSVAGMTYLLNFQGSNLVNDGSILLLHED